MPVLVLTHIANLLLLVGFSGAVYPQAIQRIYAARSGQVLQRSLRIMIFMPLLTMPVVVLVGLSGVRQWSSGDGLEGIEADQVMPMLLREWSAQGPLFYLVSVLVLLGAVAAIMSTADKEPAADHGRGATGPVACQQPGVRAPRLPPAKRRCRRDSGSASV